MKRLFFAGLASLALVGCSEGATEKPQETAQEVSAPKETVSKPEPSKAKETTLGAGKHIVGEDIPAGKYIVSTTDKTGNLFVYEDGFPVVNEILGTMKEFAVNNVSVELKDGQEIEISGINQVLFKVKK